MGEQCEQCSLASKKLFAKEVDDDSPSMGMCAVFPKINSLPGAQGKGAARHRNGKVHGRQGGANMSGHVVFTFGGMLKDLVTIGNKPCKETLKIPPHFRIGVLLYDQRSRGVLEVQSDLSGLNPRLAEQFAYLIRELVKAASARGDADLVLNLSQHSTAVLLQ